MSNTAFLNTFLGALIATKDARVISNLSNKITQLALQRFLKECQYSGYDQSLLQSKDSINIDSEVDLLDHFLAKDKELFLAILSQTKFELVVFFIEHMLEKLQGLTEKSEFIETKIHTLETNLQLLIEDKWDEIT